MADETERLRTLREDPYVSKPRGLEDVETVRLGDDALGGDGMPVTDSLERVADSDGLELEDRTLGELVWLGEVRFGEAILSGDEEVTVIVVGDGHEGSKKTFLTVSLSGIATSVDTSRMLVTSWTFLFGPSETTVTVLKSVTVMTCRLMEKPLDPPTPAVTVIVEGQLFCARTRAAPARPNARMFHMALCKVWRVP